MTQVHKSEYSIRGGSQDAATHEHMPSILALKGVEWGQHQRARHTKAGNKRTGGLASRREQRFANSEF